MTDAELEAAFQQARQVQARARDALHELTNALQVIWGEIDLLKVRARTVLEEFYTRFPEFKEEP